VVTSESAAVAVAILGTALGLLSRWVARINHQVNILREQVAYLKGRAEAQDRDR